MHYIHVCRINLHEVIVRNGLRNNSLKNHRYYNVLLMKGTYIGELEELILLTVGILYGKAYGVAVMDEIVKQTGRSLNISAVHSVLKRLEEKGLVSSSMGDPSAERGGRRKRIFLLTAAGKRALEEVNEMRNQLFNQIPKVALQFQWV